MSGNFQGLAGFYGFHVFSGVHSSGPGVIKIIAFLKVSHPSAEVLLVLIVLISSKTHIAVASPGDGAASELFQTMHAFHFTFVIQVVLHHRNGSTIPLIRFAFFFDDDYA